MVARASPCRGSATASWGSAKQTWYVSSAMIACLMEDPKGSPDRKVPHDHASVPLPCCCAAWQLPNPGERHAWQVERNIGIGMQPQAEQDMAFTAAMVCLQAWLRSLELSMATSYGQAMSCKSFHAGTRQAETGRAGLCQNLTSIKGYRLSLLSCLPAVCRSSRWCIRQLV